MTQFLQFAKGYSPLEAGAAMVPLAFGLMLGATRATKAAEKVGTKRVVAGGLIGLGATLTTALLWTSDMPYWPIGLWFFFGALSMGCIMGPATGSVMGAVPKEKSGVASAMNDVTRQVGGVAGHGRDRLADRVALRLARGRRRRRAAVRRAGAR